MTDVILDCDPGIDDALALMLAAASPELHLLGVTCVAGNRPVHTTTANASRLLALCGRTDVPVFAGSGRPLLQNEPHCNLVHGADGLGGVQLPDGAAASQEHAVDFLRRTLLEAEAGRGPVLIAVGPLTNLALAEIRDPGLLRRASRVLVMGGAFFCGGNITPQAEFNFFADPAAAHVVLASGAELVLFGLDVTSQVHMSAQWIASLAALPGQAAQAAHAMLAAYAAQDPLLHDACPVAYALAPGLFSGGLLAVSVDSTQGPEAGRCSAWDDSRCPANANVMLQVHSGDVLALVRERLALLP